MEDIKLYTMDEVADILRVSTQSVRHRIEEGKLESIKSGKRVLFTKEQIEDYLENCTVKAVEEEPCEAQV